MTTFGIYPSLFFQWLNRQQLGFTIAKINTRMAKVTFDNEVIYALPKPVAAYVAESPNVVQPPITLMN